MTEIMTKLQEIVDRSPAISIVAGDNPSSSLAKLRSEILAALEVLGRSALPCILETEVLLSTANKLECGDPEATPHTKRVANGLRSSHRYFQYMQSVLESWRIPKFARIYFSWWAYHWYMPYPALCPIYLRHPTDYLRALLNCVHNLNNHSAVTALKARMSYRMNMRHVIEQFQVIKMLDAHKEQKEKEDSSGPQVVVTQTQWNASFYIPVAASIALGLVNFMHMDIGKAMLKGAKLVIAWIQRVPEPLTGPVNPSNAGQAFGNSRTGAGFPPSSTAR